jgi:hypothetical protein
MIDFHVSVWQELDDDTITPPETFYILAENGDYITDESGNRLIQEIAP